MIKNFQDFLNENLTFSNVYDLVRFLDKICLTNPELKKYRDFKATFNETIYSKLPLKILFSLGINREEIIRLINLNNSEDAVVDLYDDNTININGNYKIHTYPLKKQ